MQKEVELKVGIFSFFTGAGFLDLGFENAGFKAYLANEIDSNFAQVYRHSREQMKIPPPEYGLEVGDVCSYLDDDSKSKDLKSKVRKAKKEMAFVGFIGGPPCPDFSVANANAKGENGKRGQLTRVYVDIICDQKPDFFVLENVKGLISTTKHREFFNRMISKLHDNGYATSYRLINALEYGAAQDRQRIILIGVKRSLCKGRFNCKTNELQGFSWDDFIRFPMDKVSKSNWPTTDSFVENGDLEMPHGVIEELTVQYWFEKNDVENHPNGKDFFVPRAGLAKMKIFAEGDDSKKCYKRVHRWRYSPTACYGNNEVHLHPYKARRLSVAETLAIQSLPKAFALPPEIPLSSKFKTIGNGVPYVAANGVAKTLMAFLKEVVK
jgi:DNA (cytosine-5)-methyltransferase 1